MLRRVVQSAARRRCLALPSWHSMTPPRGAPLSQSLSVPSGRMVHISRVLQRATDPSVEDTYQKKTPLEHVLLRPGMYIGSVESTKESMWIWSDSEECMVQRNMEFVPALYKIFDEILVNAVDNKVRDDKMSRLDVHVHPGSAANGHRPTITVFNDGKGIPIQFHKAENVYVPELVLGHLLTGSNFNDASARLTGGRHGYGAKLTNIFSAEFTVETGDAKAGKRYTQTWRDNMRTRGEPEIVSYDGPDFTRVSFSPDLPKFEMSKLSSSMMRVLRKRVFDVAGCLPNVTVTWNGDVVPVVGFESYVAAFEGSTTKEKAPSLYTRVNKRWEVGVAPSDIGFVQVSFVNGMTTHRGGTHVNVVLEQLCKRIADHINTKHKDMTVTATQIKPHLSLFVNALIENPTFDSQMKEYLTSRPATYGSACVLSERFVKSVLTSSGIVERVVAAMKTKQRTALNKKVAKKSVAVPKLEDANWAGGQRAAECTLILTEGDSAKALAVAGLSVVGRDAYGVFPLRGKFLNVRDASDAQLAKNAEFSHLCTILGLKLGAAYESDEEKASLRYGRVLIMTDQDHDGSHIKGLLLNLFHTFWPALLRDNYVSAFLTPLLKAHTTKTKKVLPFFSLPEYEQWVATHPDVPHRVKYYKGLGTSTSAEGKAYFQDLEGHSVDFEWTAPEDGDAIAMVFSKDRVAERKAWLTAMDPTKLVSERTPSVSLREFVHSELIQFSLADNLRSIPSAVDGLKPSQRKVLFACFKRKLTKEVKVAQLAGYCAEHTAYHHGEASLHSTIVNMAQDYVGANNLPLLYPSGQFGTRLQGGKDAASPRYIFTHLHKYTRLVYPEADEPLLQYVHDDGQPVEPTYYVPILPMLLVNGTEGIGTGWSTNVPSHHPVQLIDRLLTRLDGSDSVPSLQPWVKGFVGRIEPNGANYVTTGELSVVKATPKSVSVRISELPVGKWVEDYKTFLHGLVASKKLRSFTEHHTDTTVCFDLVVEKEKDGDDDPTMLRKTLKLESNINTTNMHAFDADGKLRKFDSSAEIFDAFYDVRLALYARRKEYYQARLARECLKLENRVRFQQSMASETSPLRMLWLARPSKAQVVAALRDAGFASADAFTDDDPAEQDGSDYDYLLKTSFLQFTQEHADKLEREHDAKVAELAELHATSAVDLWKAELLALREALLDDPEYRDTISD
ncbi:DNA topoisomerase 2 DNA gyrase B [Achlya hypogyna]|uniref:DNA topoisomerase 2 n=1 Tax=Achlya hypogyna TaxID=1202772 RepID=A0A1V9YXG0_ACHHY|nr:DNA topoisomerase 2 DNA gyrase B [Achlya hypogyna]